MVSFENLFQGMKFNNLIFSNKNIDYYIEEMENINTNNLDKSNDEFNQLLLEYSKTYQLIIDEVLKNQNNPLLQKYAGQNVRISEGNDDTFYYINNYGFIQPYSDESWALRPPSCLTDPIPITAAEFIQFPKAGEMQKAVACGIEGNNLQDKSTGKPVAWINIRGERLDWDPASDFKSWNNRSTSCKQANIKNLNSSNFTNLVSKGKQDENSLCSALNVDPSLLENLEKINKKLIELGKEILIDIQKLKISDFVTERKIQNTRDTINRKLVELQKDESEIQSGNLDINDRFNPNLERLREDTKLRVVSNYSIYITWLIIILILIILLSFTFKNDENTIFVKVLIFLIIVYGLFLIFKSIFGFNLDFNKTNAMFSTIVIAFIYIIIIIGIFLLFKAIL